jgi:hypothetical protein
MKLHQTNLRSLFQGVFWPAAAGNVFWSFCALIIDKSDQISTLSLLARLSLLLLLSLYLTIEWLRNYSNFPATVPWHFWFFDWLHICAVALVALTAATKAEWLDVTLIAFYLITAIGHFVGAWSATEENNQSDRISGAISLLGAAIVLIGWFADTVRPWNLPLSGFLVLLLWSVHRRDDLRNLFLDSSKVRTLSL